MIGAGFGCEGRMIMVDGVTLAAALPLITQSLVALSEGITTKIGGA